MIKQTQNQYFGRENELPRILDPGSLYIAVDTKSVFLADKNGFLVKISGEDSIYSNFDSLSDTENSKSGKSGKYLRVSDDELSIEYVDVVVPTDGIGISQQALNYSSFNPGNEIGLLAYAEESEGTKWLPGTIGGSYYPQGFYMWNGSSWESDRNAIAEQFQTLIVQMESKIEEAPLGGEAYARQDESWVPIVGTEGEAGPQGNPGIDGKDGSNGSDGSDGADGINGTNGVDGNGIVSTVDNGDGTFTINFSDNTSFTTSDLTGANGADGADGADGTNGTNGVDGTDGESAYQIALNNGFSGTETEWLESIKGEQGVQGQNGSDGVDGNDGLDGAQGPKGDTGDTGPQGLQGLQGLQGEKGEAGANGNDGSDGADGIDGLSAYQIWLSQGNSGTEQDFLDSLQGADGADGSDGEDGIDGVDGQGVPTGGSAGQILEKVDGTDYNTQWVTRSIDVEKSFTINDPINEIIPLFVLGQSITISEIRVAKIGSSDVEYKLGFGSSLGTIDTDITTNQTQSSSSSTLVNSFSNDTVSADEFVFLEIVNANSASQFHVSIKYN